MNKKEELEINKNKTSNYTGVFYRKKDNKWIAKIRLTKCRIHLGSFDTKLEAINAININAKYYEEI